MKTYYQVFFICEFGETVHRKRFETRTSLYRFFYEYLKCRDYVSCPCVYVTRYWQLKGRFYPAGSVSFFFDDEPKDYRNNRWIQNKIRFIFDGNWVFERRINSFVQYHDKMFGVSLHDYR